MKMEVMEEAEAKRDCRQWEPARNTTRYPLFAWALAIVGAMGTSEDGIAMGTSLVGCGGHVWSASPPGFYSCILEYLVPWYLTRKKFGIEPKYIKTSN